MSRIIELQNKIEGYEQQLADLMEAGKEPEAQEISDRLAEARANLMEEAELVEKENKRIAAENKRKSEKKARETVGALALGSKEAFAAMGNFWKTQIDPRDAISGLTTPQIYQTDLPGSASQPTGFLATIPHGVCDGDVHYFQQATLTNNAAGWKVGEQKAESDIAWKAATAPIEVIAHWMPISRPTANRYNELESIVNNELMNGLDYRADAYAVAGSNSNGIVGIKNQAGSISYTKASGDTYIEDMIISMRTKVRLACGFAPNRVAMSPSAIETMAKQKDGDGRYLYPDLAEGSTIRGMQVVEDVNLETVTTGDSPTTTEGILVYFNGGAQWLDADQKSLTIGLVDKQLIENSYTLLAEQSSALKVPYPGAFAYATI